MKSWLSPDGLMKLDPRDEREPYGVGLPRTVINDNGVYYLAINYLLRFLKGEKITDEAPLVDETISRLEYKPGLYLRNPGRIYAKEAHDNYLGICILSVLLSLNYHESIRAYGESHGYNYDHIGTGGLTTQRQGGEVAFYKMCCGLIPSPWEWVWLLGGLITNALIKGSNPPSDAQLAWARIEMLRVLINSHGFTRFIRMSFLVVSRFWQWRAKARFSSRLGFFKIFYKEAAHPNRVLAESLGVANG